MRRAIAIALPDELAGYSDDIGYFVRGMVDKLARNAHKGKWEDVDLKRAVELMHGEIYELMVAVAYEDVDDAVRECYDIANFALIAAAVLQRDGK